ncbi:uncharacterized protein B0T15DRAFT_530381 [Chaetomium strumarium]|uniref:SMODS and SLOG-associating 2TM effector domain-containing protein n=1 Tax=Chaetomium strumarium TaxID=1170767 RepID=A0AAJ0GWM3_9PEZI|nr:hypothetical protein B0T15DRAFT_530381 [Chaetomium strumarium]
MASSSRDQGQQIFPPPSGGRGSEIIGSHYNSETQSNIPIPPSNSGNQPPPTTGNAPPAPSTPKPPPADQPKPLGASFQRRFLTPTEWARVAHGIGAIREGEQHQVVHPTCWYWPPRGLPDGLYRDIVTHRFKYSVGFQLLNSLHWSMLVLQVTLGAILTALGSLPQREAAPITALAAVNTVSAGLLGLLHNSGLPDRYRMDKAEFIQVEDFVKEVLDTGIVDAGQTVEDVLNDCYARFQYAKSVVLSNKPEVYASSAGNANGNGKTIICPEPAAHFVRLT